MAIHTQDLIIEITRRCNMSCDHCCRGCSEAIDISEEYVVNAFKKIDNIGVLTLTGGEPSLKPDKIRMITRIAKEMNIDIDSFYIATNAMVVKDEFIMAVIELFLYCNNHDTDCGCVLDISNDMYHMYGMDESDFEKNVDKLKSLSFTRKKNVDDYETYENAIINQGFAESNYQDVRQYRICSFEIDEFDEGSSIYDAQIYLNSKGMFVADCNLSYETQDLCEFLQLGHVMNENLDLVEACKGFNQRLENAESTLLSDIIDQEYER